MAQIEVNEIERRYLERALEIYLSYTSVETHPSDEKLAVLQLLKQKIQEASK